MKFIGQTPIFLVGELEKSLQFYNKLSFDVAFQYGKPVTYCGLCRDVVELHLMDARNAAQRAGAGRLSITADDVDAVHALCLAKGVEISVPIADRAYGRRDFSVQDPDGNVIVFGGEL